MGIPRWSVLCLLLLAAMPACRGASTISAKGAQLVDELGRVVVLRGLNLPIDGKTPDFMPLTNLTTLKTLQPLGTAVARVLFIWEAFEPQQGQYNAEYLAYYKGIVQALYELDILTILEMHQDSYSRYLNKGCGDGFPQWSVLVEPVLEKPPANGLTCIAWQLQAPVDPIEKLNWSNFFAGDGGVRERFLDLWEYLAVAFAGNPGILGYDLLNEPEGDEVTEIAPLYADIAARIRKHDTAAILFIEPQFLVDGGGAIHLPQPAFTNYVLAPHYYSFVGQDNITSTVTAGTFVPFPEALASWLALTATWDAPLFLGEFGAQNDPVKAPPLIDMFYNQLDGHLLSGTQWGWTPAYNPVTKDGWNEEDYSVVDANLAIRSNYAIRPFPRAIAGNPGAFQVDAAAKKVTLSWEVTGATLAAGAGSNGVGATTVVFAPLQGFFGVSSPSQLDIQVSPSGAATDCAFEVDSLFFACAAFQIDTYTISLQPAL